MYKMSYYIARNKNELLIFATTWINLTDTILGIRSQKPNRHYIGHKKPDTN